MIIYVITLVLLISKFVFISLKLTKSILPFAQKYANNNLKSREPGSGIANIYSTGEHFTLMNRRNIKNLVTPKDLTCTGTIAIFLFCNNYNY